MGHILQSVRGVSVEIRELRQKTGLDFLEFTHSYPILCHLVSSSHHRQILAGGALSHVPCFWSWGSRTLSLSLSLMLPFSSFSCLFLVLLMFFPLLPPERQVLHFFSLLQIKLPAYLFLSPTTIKSSAKPRAI